MFDSLPQILLRHRILVGGFAILIAVVTWSIDLFGLVYECPFCRSQRTVIGLLGLLLLLPDPGHWLVRYLSAVFAAFGLSVASTSIFAAGPRSWAGNSNGVRTGI